MLNVNDALARNCAKLWSQVIKFDMPADALLSKFFRENRKFNIKERNVIAETTYTMLRNYQKLSAIINPQSSFTLIGYTWLNLLGVGRHEIRELKCINLGELDKLPKLDQRILELPQWLVKRLEEHHDDAFIEQLSAAISKPAPLTIRANLVKMGRNDIVEKLNQLEHRNKLTEYSPYGIKLINKAALMKNELLLSGAIEVQDEASQLAGMLLEPKRGDMIADFCAGSGGKTLLIGMMMRNSGRIYAFDTNERRLSNLTPRLARSGLSNVFPQLIASENDTKIKRLAGKMDRVFVDVPCSGIGTSRRNPDLKFRQNEASVAEMLPKQLSILTAASNLVKPGGRLVYATCSILYAENQGIVNQFLSEHTDFEIVKINQILKDIELPNEDDDYLQLYPHTHDTDGFFACVLQKKNSDKELHNTVNLS